MEPYSALPDSLGVFKGPTKEREGKVNGREGKGKSWRNGFVPPKILAWHPLPVQQTALPLVILA